MKTKITFLLIFTTYLSFSQLREIDELQGSSSLLSFAVLDNDIYYSAQIAFSGFDRYDFFISNGTQEGTVSVSPNKSFLLRTQNYSNLELETIVNKDYRIGPDLFAYTLENHPGTQRIYKFNKSKTSMEQFDQVSSNGSDDVSSRIYPLAKNAIALIKTSLNTIDSIDNSRDFDIKIHTPFGIRNYEFNGIINREDPVNRSALLTIDIPFIFKGDLWFVGKNDSGRLDFYRFRADLDRITDAYKTSGTSSGVDPRNIYANDNFNYIYFSGNYLDDELGATKHYGREVCYTAGEEFDNGSVRGYKAFYTIRNEYDIANSHVLSVTDNAIYFLSQIDYFVYGITFDAQNNATVQTLFSTPNSTESYEIDRFTVGNTTFFLVGNTIYETTGTTNSVTQHELIKLEGESFYPGHYDFKDGIIYMAGSYYPSSGRTYNIVSFDCNTKESKIENTLPTDGGALQWIRKFNNGFAFTRAKGGIYTIDADVRSSILDPNAGAKSSQKSNSITLNYNDYDYNVTVNSSDLPVSDKLKVELLDTLSTHFKSKITSLPDKSFSKTYYKINTLTDGNTHNSNITLSFNDNDFEAIVSQISDISIVAYENDSFEELQNFSVDFDNKTLTLTHSFGDEAILFFKNQNVLSTNAFDTTLLKIYPNPTSKILNITIDNQTIKSVTFYSILGKKVKTNYLKNGVVNISNLNKGIYTVKVKTDKNIFIRKIIKI